MHWLLGDSKDRFTWCGHGPQCFPWACYTILCMYAYVGWITCNEIEVLMAIWASGWRRTTCCLMTAVPAMQCYLFEIIGVESRPSIVMAIWSINRRLKATSGVYWWIINMDMAKNRHTEPGPTCWQHLLVAGKLLLSPQIAWNWNFGKFSLKKKDIRKRINAIWRISLQDFPYTWFYTDLCCWWVLKAIFIKINIKAVKQSSKIRTFLFFSTIL